METGTRQGDREQIACLTLEALEGLCLGLGAPARVSSRSELQNNGFKQLVDKKTLVEPIDCALRLGKPTSVLQRGVFQLVSQFHIAQIGISSCHDGVDQLAVKLELVTQFVHSGTPVRLGVLRISCFVPVSAEQGSHGWQRKAGESSPWVRREGGDLKRADLPSNRICRAMQRNGP